MRITQEADYALRIASYLAAENRKTGAKVISEQSNVPIRFCIKILQKLSAAGIVKSFKGVSGGYMLDRADCDISLKDIIEAVEGPIVIHRCLDSEYCCSNAGDSKHKCVIHGVFDRINTLLSDKLGSIKLSMLNTENGAEEIEKILG